MKPNETLIYKVFTKNNSEVIHSKFNKVNKDISNTKFYPERSGNEIVMIAIGDKASLGNVKSTLMIPKEIQGLEYYNLIEVSLIHTLDNKNEIQRINQF